MSSPRRNWNNRCILLRYVSFSFIYIYNTLFVFQANLNRADRYLFKKYLADQRLNSDDLAGEGLIREVQGSPKSLKQPTW